MWRVGVTVWATVESGRIIGTLFDRLLAEDYNAIVVLLIRQKRHNALGSEETLSTCRGSEHEIIERRRSEIRGPLGSFGDC
jgi:hypothetical protein